MEVTPLLYTGLDTEPYNAFSLTCMATKPTEVIPNISLTWFHNGTQLDTSVLGVSISEDESSSGAMKSSQLSVDADDPSDSGSYSCQASLAIPESDTVESSQASLITIIGNTMVHTLSLSLQHYRYNDLWLFFFQRRSNLTSCSNATRQYHHNCKLCCG